MKNTIKIVTKISLLARNDQFSPEELKLATEFQKKFHKASKTVISFHEVDFSYDQKFLMQVKDYFTIYFSFVCSVSVYFFHSY